MPMSIAEDPQVFAAQADQATVYKDSTRQEVGNDLVWVHVALLPYFTRLLPYI